MVAELEQQRRSDMASIGTFKKSGHEFQGEIVTLSVQTKGVRIVPETNRASENAPCPFRKFDPARIRVVRQNHRIIRIDVCDPVLAWNVHR